jgi:hypothetical protein
MAAIATKRSIADCNELAGEVTEVLAGVLAGDGALVGPGTGLAFVVDVELGIVVDVEVQVNFL